MAAIVLTVLVFTGCLPAAHAAPATAPGISANSPSNTSGNTLANSLVINTGRDAPFYMADGSGFYNRLLDEMFRRIGGQVKLVLLPAARSLINANKGVEDGNIARIRGIEKQFTNLVRVPEKIIDFYFSAFTLDPGNLVASWDQLAEYNVAYINGWYLLDRKVKHYKSLTRARDTRQLFHLLENRRADIVIFNRESGLWWRAHHAPGIHIVEPPLGQAELFLYLHKQHRNLVEPLARALRAMKQDGSYMKIITQTLGERPDLNARQAYIK